MTDVVTSGIEVGEGDIEVGGVVLVVGFASGVGEAFTSLVGCT